MQLCQTMQKSRWQAIVPFPTPIISVAVHLCRPVTWQYIIASLVTGNPSTLARTISPWSSPSISLSLRSLPLTFWKRLWQPREATNLLIILNRFSKLIHIGPLKAVTYECMTKAFVIHRVTSYAPPPIRLYKNGMHFTSRVFHHVCQILGVGNAFTTTCHTQTNNQIEQNNCTIIAGLHHCVKQHLKD